MEIIDSNDKKLDPPEILIRAVDGNNGAAAEVGVIYPLATALATIAREMQMPRAEMVQVGNTLFLSHRGKKNNKRKMVGRALNVDTGRNFCNNMLEYAHGLQKRGITHYTTWFNGEGFLNGFRLMQRVADRADTDIGIATRDEGGYIVYVRFGKQPVPLRVV